MSVALLESEGPLMTLLTVSVGGEGSETVIVPFETENVSTVYEEAKVIVPRLVPVPPGPL